MSLSAALLMTSAVLAGLPLGHDAPDCKSETDEISTGAPALLKFVDLLAELERAVEDLKSPHAAILPEARRAVEQTLDQLRFHPRLVDGNSGAQAAIDAAMLRLAASYLEEDPQLARRWVDRGLSRKDARKLEAASLPDFAEPDDAIGVLFEQRKQDFQQKRRGLLRLNCEHHCEAYVDGRRIDFEGRSTEVEVSVGQHDVWLFAYGDGGYGTFEVVEVEPGDQHCVFFTREDLVLLPTVDEWWNATGYARRLEWAIDCRKDLDAPTTGPLEEVLGESGDFAKILARDRELRRRRILAYLTLADLQLASGPTDAKALDETIDRVLMLSGFDADLDIKRALQSFGSLQQHYATRTAEIALQTTGTLAFECFGRCVPTIEGVPVTEGALAVLPGTYDVSLFSFALDEEPERRRVTAVAEEIVVVEFEAWAEAFRQWEPVDDRVYVSRGSLDRWIWGTSGGIALAGAVVWPIGIAVGSRVVILSDNPDANEFAPIPREKAIQNGTAMAATFVLHAGLAAFFLTRMPPSDRPGLPMVAAGSGLIAGAAVFAGLGAVAYSAEENAEEEGAEGRTQTARGLMISSFVIGSSMFVSGTSLLAIGATRYKRFKRKNLTLLPVLSPQSAGVVFAGRF